MYQTQNKNTNKVQIKRKCIDKFKHKKKQIRNIILNEPVYRCMEAERSHN